MMRLWAFGAVTHVVLAVGMCGCTSESSRSTTAADPCALGGCGSDDGGGLRDASADDAGPRDASIADTGPSGAVVGWDGARPPIDDASGSVPVRDAAWEDGGVVGPGGPVLPGAVPNRAICSNAGPLGFSTQSLTATSLPRGVTGTDPISAPWSAAAQRTGAPGPALLVLDTLGLLPDGGLRNARLGAPRTTSGSSPFGFLQIANNPIATNWSVLNTYVVSADTGMSPVPAATLRFKAAAGGTVDVPIAGTKLDGRFVIDLATEACTSLQVSTLDLFIPTSAGATQLEGQSLSSMLGAPNIALGGQNIYWRVTLRGSAPVVALQASP